MGYIECKGKDCPICATFGKPQRISFALPFSSGKSALGTIPIRTLAEAQKILEAFNSRFPEVRSKFADLKIDKVTTPLGRIKYVPSYKD